MQISCYTKEKFFDLIQCLIFPYHSAQFLLNFQCTHHDATFKKIIPLNRARVEKQKNFFHLLLPSQYIYSLCVMSDNVGEIKATMAIMKYMRNRVSERLIMSCDIRR